ncbi:MAG TPA: ABC transporter permease [Chitinophagaceae bacterium]|nr:ABC transporter permease [Chitinophagaceae bacterium]
MIKNHFKIAWRNLIRNKSYSAINIGGLAVGMAVAMLIGLWIYDELSFNKAHKNYVRIAHVMRHSFHLGEKQTGGTNSPIPLGTKLHSSLGNNFTYIVRATKTLDYTLSNGEKAFTQSGRFMEPDAPKMFTLNMVQGHLEGLKEINSILLSETVAKKIFGDTDPINKVITIDTRIDVKVTGVYEDFKRNSAFNDVSYIAPFDLYISFNPWTQKLNDNWRDNSFPLYVQIAPQTSFEDISAKIKDVMLPHLDEESKADKPEVFLHPMAKWHLYSNFKNGVNIMSEPLKFVWFYGIIGIFVLFLACINFMNLSTARSEKRAKEVGIRKAIGTLRMQLINQFLSESLLFTLFSFVISLVIVQLLLPWFNNVSGKGIAILWTNPWFWLSGIAFTIFTAILAGSYPAFYLSSFQPIKVLKEFTKGGSSAAISRKILVVFQFTISITLIIGTFIVYHQIQYSKNRPVGYDRNDLIVTPKLTGLQGKSEVLRSELLRTGVVIEVAESSSPLTSVGSNDTGFDWEGKDPALDKDMGSLRVSYEYGKTIGWQFINGRDFSRKFTTDSTGFVINETAAKLMGFANPIGETVRCKFIREGENFKILGVVKDMVMESPFEPVRPSVFFLGRCRWIYLKINPQISTHAAMPKIEAAFKKIIPTVPFDYKFVDDEYAAKFIAEERISNLASFFAILAIFISCLGLFGLASFVAEQRTKEIGIRKVLGASVLNLWKMLSKEFVALVIISCLIAIPIAWYFLNQWLQNYNYRIEISWWIFAAVGAGALIITLLTVSFQAIKAAISNPVKSLRTE